MALDLDECRSRVYAVNTSLRKIGFSWEEVETFWEECFAEAKAGKGIKPTAQNFGKTPGTKAVSSGEVYINSKK